MRRAEWRSSDEGMSLSHRARNRLANARALQRTSDMTGDPWPPTSSFFCPATASVPKSWPKSKRSTGYFARAGIAHFEIEKGLVGGCAYDAHGAGDQRGRHGARRAPPTRCCLAAVGGPKWDGVPYEVRPEAGLLRLRKDLALLRQFAAGDLLSGARRRLVAEARDRRRARHHDRARIDRRRLFRRAQADHRSRQRPEARHRHAGLRHLRDRTHRPRRLRPRAQTPQQGHVVREAQCDEIGRAVARGRSRRCTSANSPT